MIATRPAPRPTTRTSCCTAWALVACSVLLLAAGCRIWCAWLLRHETNPDYAIVLLMVRRVLAGDPWPVFFYGQAYMGSFEPLVSAAVAALCGFSPFAVNLGTALFGIAATVAAADWVRRMAGWPAAAATAAFGSIGPLGYLHYLGSPRGGYGALLLATIGILSLTARLIERSRTGRMPLWAGLLLGLIAGLGFWSHFLVAPAVLAAALAILIFQPAAACNLRLIAVTCAGFMVGSAPFWLWNAAHGWASFSMGESLQPSVSTAVHHARLLAKHRIPQLLGVDAAGRGWMWLTLGAHLLLVLAAFARLAWPVRRGEENRPCAATGLTLALLYLICFAALFCFSSYARLDTPRYLLPLLPVLAVLAGVAATGPNRLLRWTACGALLVAMAGQAMQIAPLRDQATAAARRSERYRAALDHLQASGADAVYAAYLLHIFNVLSEERITFTDPRLERQPRCTRIMEEAARPAVLENLGGVGEWVAGTAGQCTFRMVGGLRVHTDFHPPDGALREIAPSSWKARHEGRDVSDALADRAAATGVAHASASAGERAIQVAFDRPVQLAAVRVWGLQSPFDHWRIEGRASADAPFRPVTPDIPCTPFFWSGPRFFAGGTQQRQEARLDGGPVTELRLYLATSVRCPEWSFSELQFLERTGESRAAPLEPLPAMLAARGITRLHADRWHANELHRLTGGTVWTQRHPQLTAEQGDLLAPAAGTAVLMPHEGVPSLRQALAAAGIASSETDLDAAGILFTVPSPATASHAAVRLCGAYAMLAGQPSSTAPTSTSPADPP